MATFKDILKSRRESGESLFSSLASASVGRARESMDYKNKLFKSGSLLNALFPKIKGYSPLDKVGDKIKKSPSNVLMETQNTVVSETLIDIGKNSRISAKNSMALPEIAKQINIMQKNVQKLVKVQGETPVKKADAFFSSAKFRENAYEASFRKGLKTTTTTPTPTKETEGKKSSLFPMLALGGISALFGSLSKVVKPLLSIFGSIGSILGGTVISGLLGLGKVLFKVLSWLVKSKIGKILGLAGLIAGGALAQGAEDMTGDMGGGETQPSLKEGLSDTTKTAIVGAGTAVVAASAVSTGRKIASVAGKTGEAIMDARTQSVSQLAKSTPKTTWGRFLAYVAKKSPQLWGKIGLKLTQAGALMAIPLAGWVMAAVQLGFTLWTAWELYELWKEFNGTAEERGAAKSTSPSEIPSGDLTDPEAALMSGANDSPQQVTPTSPTPIGGAALLNKVMDQEGIQDDSIRDRIMSLAAVESGMNPMAKGPVIQSGMHKGDQAQGILQVMPKTATEVGFKAEDLNDPEKAATAGVRYFLKNYNRLGSLDAATIAHHAGPGKGQEFLRTGSVGTKDRATGLSTMDYLAKVTGQTRASGASLASASSSIADGRMTMAAAQPILVNAPTTNNMVGSNKGSTNLIVADTLDRDFWSILSARIAS